MTFELQPTLADDLIRLRPLAPGDFEALFAVASDPLIWEQHPTRERYQRDVFSTYFEGGIASGGALLALDGADGSVVGCTRFYDLEEDCVAIGYTFLARRCWGGRHNPAMKRLMLDHAFRFVERVVLHVGRNNVRSRTAVERLGATLIGELVVAYYGEQNNVNVVYELRREVWQARSAG